MATFEKFEEQIFLNTIRIENLSDNEAGTGFLIEQKFDDKRVRHLLFSNKHVFWGRKDWRNTGRRGTKELQFIFHKKKDDGSYDLDDVHVFRARLDENTQGYFEHPDKEVDVCCVNVSDAYNLMNLNARSASIEDFSNYSFDEIHPGMDIVFPGYPWNYYDEKNFLPVLRGGLIASIPSIDFNGERKVVIDANVYPGSSGSPVYVKLLDKNKYGLLGILSSSPPRAVESVDVPDDNIGTKNISITRIGIGEVFKLETILEVCKLSEAIKPNEK